MRIKNFDTNKNILYIVATPIGNLKDFSPRAVEILNEVAAIGCEDTRVSGLLLSHFNISKKLISCHEHNEEQASDELLKYLENGNIAYISDAGYPAVSDPGYRLVNKALQHNYKVSVIPGANAMLCALVGSGLDTSHFYFHGFLNSKSSSRIKELETLKEKRETLVFYESPHRIKNTLNDIYKVFGNRKATLARELTKRFEQFIREDLMSLSSMDENEIKGEIVLVVEGNNEVVSLSEKELKDLAKELINRGYNTKTASKMIADKYGVSKNAIYEMIIKG